MVPQHLKQVIQRIHDLPTLPRTILKITELVNNPKTSAKDLAKVITDDQVLTARLLKLVNSSFYGFPQKISTVTGAIVLLGFDAIRNLLLTTSVFDLFSNKHKANKDLQEKFWDHSLGCAIGAKAIGSFLKSEQVEELFVAGLLHDIGKIVEMMILPQEFELAVQKTRDTPITIYQAEEEVLGFTHTEVGRVLAEKWNLPSKLTKIIAHHHHPAKAGRFAEEAAVIHVADIFCRALGLGSGGDERMPPLEPDAWSRFTFSSAVIDHLLQEIDRTFYDISSVLVATKAEDKSVSSMPIHG
uniref:HDOD domain-containing protein n=1 Tax=Desulfatirhabdium butyrativorans TaxID=340467 RepID=A0A7C4MMI0_9BACT